MNLTYNFPQPTSQSKIEEWCRNQHFNFELIDYNTNLHILGVIIGIHLLNITIMFFGEFLNNSGVSYKAQELMTIMLQTTQLIMLIGYILFSMGLL